VAEANAPGLPHLAEVENEVRAVSDLFAASSVSVTNATSATSGVQAVLAQLPSAALLHLACHGQQLLDPLDSHFALRDGGLTIKELMKMQLPHATLAFLSACETAKGSEAFTDQVQSTA
jgi:CHAT domain-containing protein